ncbi:MAG: HAD family hydrolase [Defluviitaleaceae bacterium]|nr:HAD family hydrolase [Defluviitaleaceae bacterium]
MNVKMIVCDLDGTLLRTDKTVSDFTLEALEKCRQQGIIFAVATARSISGARLFTNYMTPDALVYNGGAGATVGGNRIFENPMPRDLVSALINSLLSVGSLNFSTENDEGYFYHGTRAQYADYLEGLGLKVAEIDPNGYIPPKHKLTAVIGQDKVPQILTDHPELAALTYSDTGQVRFALKNATKWHGVLAVAKHFSVNTAQIAAFGDDYNDIDMLQNCGMGIAMGNAIDDVKSVSDYICETNDDDGVAKWLTKNILGGIK